MFAMEAEEEDPEPKAKMQKKLDKLRYLELKLFHDFVWDEIWKSLYYNFSVTSDVPNPITKMDLSTALKSVNVDMLQQIKKDLNEWVMWAIFNLGHFLKFLILCTIY